MRVSSAATLGKRISSAPRMVWLSLFLVLQLAACARSDHHPTAQVRHAGITYPAPGIHCENCVRTLETTLRKLPGVDSVSANLERKDVVVFADTTRTSRADVAMVIARLGFDTPPDEAAE